MQLQENNNLRFINTLFTTNMIQITMSLEGMSISVNNTVLIGLLFQ